MTESREEQEQLLRDSPKQFKLIYAMIATSSDAWCSLIAKTYEASGMALPQGPSLFEITAFLLNDVLRLMAGCRHDRDVFDRFNDFAYDAVAFDLHPRLLANTNLRQVTALRVKEYWQIDSSTNDAGDSGIRRVERLVMHLDAATQSSDTIQMDHPVVIYDVFKNYEIKVGIVAHYSIAGPLLAHTLKPLYDTTTDICSLDVDTMNELMVAGARKARSMREECDEKGL